jgi:hypothetical protein
MQIMIEKNGEVIEGKGCREKKLIKNKWGDNEKTIQVEKGRRGVLSKEFFFPIS